MILCRGEGIRRNSSFVSTRKDKNPPQNPYHNEHLDGPIGAVALRFTSFMEDYRSYFRVARHNVSDKARSYMAGLILKAPRKNMERMEEYVQDCDYQSQQQFISDSPWDHDALTARIAAEVSDLIGDDDSTLILDESGFSKKGVKSAGVARQWNGRLGKVDNCQVGVFAALTDGTHSALVDKRLYLPETWTSDIERCKAARVPDTEHQYRSKTQLAWEMIQSASDRGMNFGWVALDALYGSAPWLLHAIDDLGKQYVADVRSNQRVYTEEPKPKLSEPRKSKNRKSTKPHSDHQSVRVDKIFDRDDARKWRKIHIRPGTKGNLEVWASRRRVWMWDGEENRARSLWAVCIIDACSGDTKWFLSNAPQAAKLEVIVKQHARRFWIERSFQDAKTSLGMADYQARGWLAWQHHMSMVMLAMLFIMKERKINQKEVEFLSYTDIIEMLGVYLPRGDVRPEEVYRNIERRHKKRRAGIESAQRARERKRIKLKDVLTK